MRKRIRRTFILLTLVVSAGWPVLPARAESFAADVPAGSWQIDPARSEVRFTVRKLGFEDVTGVFRESEGEIRYDPALPAASTIRWRIRVASVLTDASNRDRTLQGQDYFDADSHPYLSFTSRAVRARGDGTLDVSGDITIRGISRPLTIVVRPRSTTTGPSFETDFEVDRYDFGVVGGSFFGRLISRQVRVHIVVATVPLRPSPSIRMP
jgi:polyisoprenoid-binding protein YceI